MTGKSQVSGVISCIWQLRALAFLYSCWSSNIECFEGLIYSISGLFKRSLPERATEDEIDDDVANEKQKVSEMTTTDLQLHNLVLRDLSKYYGNFLAVNQLSIAIKQWVSVENLLKPKHLLIISHVYSGN